MCIIPGKRNCVLLLGSTSLASCSNVINLTATNGLLHENCSLINTIVQSKTISFHVSRVMVIMFP